MGPWKGVHLLGKMVRIRKQESVVFGQDLSMRTGLVCSPGTPWQLWGPGVNVYACLGQSQSWELLQPSILGQCSTQLSGSISLFYILRACDVLDGTIHWPERHFPAITGRLLGPLPQTSGAPKLCF
eukprot:1143561-Pelagomonas_calceolata.AAC.3